jgi:hypothetical protein
MEQSGWGERESEDEFGRSAGRRKKRFWEENDGERELGREVVKLMR